MKKKKSKRDEKQKFLQIDPYDGVNCKLEDKISKTKHKI